MWAPLVVITSDVMEPVKTNLAMPPRDRWIVTIDPSEVALRLAAAIEHAGGRAAIAERTGIPLSSIDRYCRNQSEPPASRLGEIARACGVSSDLLIFGEDASPTMATAQFASAPAKVDDEKVALVPLLDVIASAGPGRENPFSEPVGHLAFPRPWLNELGVPDSAVYLLDIHGDSMEPTIRDGWTCVLDTRFQSPRVEGIYALIDGSDFRVKRIGRGWEGKIVLISDNERYESETLAAPEAEALRIAGKIVWAGGKV